MIICSPGWVVGGHLFACEQTWQFSRGSNNYLPQWKITVLIPRYVIPCIKPNIMPCYFMKINLHGDTANQQQAFSVFNAGPVTLDCNSTADVLKVYLTIISLSYLHSVILFTGDTLPIEEWNTRGLDILSFQSYLYP